MKTLNAFAVCLRRSRWSGLAARFATCPPRFALLLDLRKTHNQSALFEMIFYALCKTYFLATGTACLPKRSQGGARRAGDMSIGRYAVPVAGLDTASVILSKCGYAKSEG